MVLPVSSSFFFTVDISPNFPNSLFTAPSTLHLARPLHESVRTPSGGCLAALRASSDQRPRRPLQENTGRPAAEHLGLCGQVEQAKVVVLVRWRCSSHGCRGFVNALVIQIFRGLLDAPTMRRSLIRTTLQLIANGLLRLPLGRCLTLVGGDCREQLRTASRPGAARRW